MYILYIANEPFIKFKSKQDVTNYLEEYGLGEKDCITPWPYKDKFGIITICYVFTVIGVILYSLANL